MKIFNFDEFFFFPDLAEMGIKFETDCLRTTDSDHTYVDVAWLKPLLVFVAKDDPC